MAQVSDAVYEQLRLDDYLEGYVKVLDHRLFFKSFGSGSAGTVLCLHGGPAPRGQPSMPCSRVAYLSTLDENSTLRRHNERLVQQELFLKKWSRQYRDPLGFTSIGKKG